MSQNPPLPLSRKQKTARIFIALFVFLLSVGISMMLYVTYMSYRSDDDKPVIDDDKLAPFVTVGDETIYGSDFAYEDERYPEIDRESKKKMLTDKLIRDSVILQSAEKEGLITLNQEFFNSGFKDYEARLAKVEEAQQNYEERGMQSVSGAVVAIWFMNYTAGPVGYEKGKEIAYQKIKPIYDAVASGQITIQEASNRIKNDSSLAQVDSAYKTNAYLPFTNEPMSKKIVFDTSFDSHLKSLTPGQVSELTLVKDNDQSDPNRGLVDAVYMFGVLTSKNDKGNALVFDEWVAQQVNRYEITTTHQ